MELHPLQAQLGDVSDLGHRPLALMRVHADEPHEGTREIAAGLRPYQLDIAAKGEVAVVANIGIGGGDADTISVIDLKLDPPRVVNTYTVYARDIAPLGFKTIEMTQLVSNQVVEQTRELLHNKVQREEWAETNYKLGLKYFSYAVAQRKLAARLANLFGEGI